jgi:hypothetical protein
MTRAWPYAWPTRFSSTHFTLTPFISGTCFICGWSMASTTAAANIQSDLAETFPFRCMNSSDKEENNSLLNRAINSIMEMGR